jgi:hypothetical protein
MNPFVGIAAVIFPKTRSLIAGDDVNAIENPLTTAVSRGQKR